MLPCSCWNRFKTIFLSRRFASPSGLPIVLLGRQKHFDLHISAIMIQDLLRQIWLMILREFLYHHGSCTMEFFLEQHISAWSCIATLSHSECRWVGVTPKLFGSASCERETRFIILMLLASIAKKYPPTEMVYDRKRGIREMNRLDVVEFWD